MDDSGSNALPFSVGSTIAGKYIVDRVLGGAPGMGFILEAHHVALERRVAIAVLKPSAIADTELVARFSRQARAAARLRSQHVARVLDVGQTASGLPYMVMEHLDGEDLSRVVRSRGPLPMVDAAECVLQACEGLAEAHAVGIVHGDLKATNLFLTKATDGTPLVKLLDFGCSSDALGVDPRADIRSLGAVLFQLLTNQPLPLAVRLGEGRYLRTIRPDVPEALVQVVLKCLAKDTAQRYATVSELARALVAFAPPRSAQSVARIQRVAALASRTLLAFVEAQTGKAPDVTKPSEAVVIERRNKRRAALIALAGLLGIMAVVGVVAFTSLRAAPASVPFPAGTPASASAALAHPSSRVAHPQKRMPEPMYGRIVW